MVYFRVVQLKNRFLLSSDRALFELQPVVVQPDAILTPHSPNALLFEMPITH